MSQRRARSLSLVSLAASAVLGLTVLAAPSAQAGGDHGGGGPGEPKVIASGLDNPRQLSFTRSGDLLVAEAGAGGSGPCWDGPENGRVCFGATGAVTKVSRWGKQSRIIAGLPSIAGEGTGEQAAGPSDVAAEGDAVTVLIGLGADPAARTAPGMPTLAKRMGTLVQTTTHGGSPHNRGRARPSRARRTRCRRPTHPIATRSVCWCSTITTSSPTRAATTSCSVSRRGGVRLVTTFAARAVETPIPNPEMQAVPTSVAVKGWDGAYYVSQLTGFPFPKGGASIYRVDPRTGAQSVYATGLTNVTDLAFVGGTLYAVQTLLRGSARRADRLVGEGAARRHHARRPLGGGRQPLRSVRDRDPRQQRLPDHRLGGPGRRAGRQDPAVASGRRSAGSGGGLLQPGGPPRHLPSDDLGGLVAVEVLPDPHAAALTHAPRWPGTRYLPRARPGARPSGPAGSSRRFRPRRRGGGGSPPGSRWPFLGPLDWPGRSGRPTADRSVRLDRRPAQPAPPARPRCTRR